MLEGRIVRLEPLTIDHTSALCEVGLDPSLWEVGLEKLSTPPDMAGYVARALADPKTNAFAVRHLATDRIVGCTRYMNMELAHGRLEIGSTWYSPEFQRTGVNTECKYLLLTHAFDVMGLTRVELKTDGLNVRSQTAMKRIGAKEEGTLRKHMLTWTGRLRDTVYFSILREEWPEVKAKLEAMRDR